MYERNKNIYEYRRTVVYTNIFVNKLVPTYEYGCTDLYSKYLYNLK